MKGAGIRGLVEIQIASEHFVRPFSAQHHLDAHGFDDPCQQIHGSRGPYRSHIISFYMIYDVLQGIQTFLYGIVYFMMDSPYMVCHHLRL